MADPQTFYTTISEAMGDVLVGNDHIVQSVSVALLTRGHVLLEGVPGIAKTTIARAFANATGLTVSRIQMTPDVLPADITGTYVYREQEGTFELHEGPIFANIVIADEINRATPKTQSALLEAMQEGQVTIEGDTRSLPEPFMVVATQNPIEMEGTFELPVAQRDRFQQKVTVSLPRREVERELLDRFDQTPTLDPQHVNTVFSRDDLMEARGAVEAVFVADAVKEYVLDLVAASRDHPDIRHGASPRASIMVLQAAKAVAALNGREYVIPDDVKAILLPVLSHRFVLETEAELGDVTAAEIIEEIREDVAPPSSDAFDAPRSGSPAPTE